MTLPPGWGWLAPVLPLEPATATLLEWTLLGASALATVGLFTRVTAPVAALLSIYALGLPNFYAKIDHAYQAIVLCALILAASPCADALSVASAWRRWRGYASAAPGSVYTLPMRLCWLILGTVYFFPGIFKFWHSGDQPIASNDTADGRATNRRVEIVVATPDRD